MKVYTISWDTICKDKGQGGLGIRRLQFMNDAFLMKVGWKLRVQPENICSKVLSSKYGRGEDLTRFCVVKNGDSLLWKELGKVWDKINNGQCWSIGNGNEAFFWTDVWGEGF